VVLFYNTKPVLGIAIFVIFVDILTIVAYILILLQWCNVNQADTMDDVNYSEKMIFTSEKNGKTIIC
jgi:hypothetical protein